MNESARLYGLFKLMQSLDRSAAFRVDLFPCDYAADLRNALPIQDLRLRTGVKVNRIASSFSAGRDENAEETLRQYDGIIKKYECSPHFRANIVAFSDDPGLAKLMADAAGAEAIENGSYCIDDRLPAPEHGAPFNVLALMDRPVVVPGQDVSDRLGFLTNLFLLDEIRPFFCFPVLHDGETIEMPKETAPSGSQHGRKASILHLGHDENGHEVFYPIELLTKHAFIAGAPGSGKTNTMLYLATSLWKNHKIPFLIMEPAKKEYRALAKIDGMDDLMIFSPSSGTPRPAKLMKSPKSFIRLDSLTWSIKFPPGIK